MRKTATGLCWLLLVLLTGCLASSDPVTLVAQQVGTPVENVVARMGRPSGNRGVDNGRELFWTSRVTSVRSSSRRGLAGANYGVFPVFDTTSESSACELTLAVDEAGLVMDYRFDGPPAGCSRFVRGLQPQYWERATP